MLRRERSRWFPFVAAVALLAVLAGCADESSPSASQGTAYGTLTTYMADNSLDLPNVLNGWIIAASAVAGSEGDYYIMDIRSAADYGTGHIEGAVSSSLGNILADAASAGGGPILVVCYTGQSASHAVVALRLSGYADAKVLKFGMSSWNADFDKWTPNTGNVASGHANWSDAAVAAAQDFDPPDLPSSSTDGAQILAERVSAMLAGGFKGVGASSVLDSPGNYFIDNYWVQADVDHYGHIAGAYRIKEDLSVAGGGFQNLDPDETVVTYCWTGQTSSLVTAYLTVLGYDALSLKFGTNAMIYDDLESHTWVASADYAYTTE